MTRGCPPRTTIGSVNLAEFSLTFVLAGVFVFLVEETPLVTVGGLVLGGVFAAPVAAIVCRRVKARVPMIAVGLLIATLSAFNLAHALG